MSRTISPMSGWKTKLGAFLVAISATIGGSAELLPVPEAAPWIKFVAYIVAGVGGAFTVWGIAHKLEKNNKVIVQKKIVPYYTHPIDPEEFKLIQEIRKPKPKAPDSGSISYR